MLGVPAEKELYQGVVLPNVRPVIIGLLCAAVWVAPVPADNHPYDLRAVNATTTGVTLKLLLQQCDAAPEDMSANFCTGYIAAAFDQLSLAQRICPPKHLTTRQIFDVGRAYLFGHAMHQDMHPGWLLSEAFREAYACAAK